MENDAGLGNGGLGRLAACFLDSLASLNLPGHGMGIRYKHGLFEQKIVDGHQVELPEQWLKNGNVWEVRNADQAVDVPFWGKVHMTEKSGRLHFRHEQATIVTAVPYDIPVIITAVIFCLISEKQKRFLNSYIPMTPMMRGKFYG
ncbi:glycogen/starch/alpha-glucan phosphorylase [Bacillus subtilis]